MSSTASELRERGAPVACKLHGEPEHTSLHGDPLLGRGCVEKGCPGGPVIEGHGPRPGDTVRCADGVLTRLNGPLLVSAGEDYVRFLTEPPCDHPFYALGGVGIRTVNFSRPLFYTDRVEGGRRCACRIGWDAAAGCWEELTIQEATAGE